MATAFSALRQQVGRLLGSGDAAMLTGTPTGTYTTAGFAASAFDQYENDYFNEWPLRIYLGTHKDTTRTITDFVKTGGVFTFSPAVVANIDATDLFELHRDFKIEEINDAINMAIRIVEAEALAEKVDESLVVDDLLIDGLFEIWTSSSVLTNWTKGGTGTLAQESTIKLEGLYSAKLTNTAANAVSLSQSVSNPKRFSGETASLYARVNTNTASRVRIRLTDGVTTWNSDYHDGRGWREAEDDPWLKIEDKTLSTALTALTASLEIDTGGAIDAYIDKMYLISGSVIYEYTIPSGFYDITALTPESSTVGIFKRTQRLDGRRWQVLGASTKKLWIDRDIVTLKAGRRLRIEGYALASQLTLDADTTPISPAYIVQQAVSLLHQARIVEGSSEHMAQFRAAQALADRERRGLLVRSAGQRV